jgi:hypothetical protein
MKAKSAKRLPQRKLSDLTSNAAAVRIVAKTLMLSLCSIIMISNSPHVSLESPAFTGG